MVAVEVGVTYKWLHWGRGWSEWLQLIEVGVVCLWWEWVQWIQVLFICYLAQLRITSSLEHR